MRITTLIYVFFFSSLLLILPTMRPTTEIDLLPLIEKSMSLNVQGTAIQFESNVEGGIVVEWSYYNPETENLISSSTTFYGLFKIELAREPGLQRGYYNFTFTAAQLAKVLVWQSGIPQESLAFIGTMSIFAMIAFLRKRVSTDFDY